MVCIRGERSPFSTPTLWEYCYPSVAIMITRRISKDKVKGVNDEDHKD